MTQQPDIGLLDPARVAIRRNRKRRLRLRVGEKEYKDIRIVRLFPISERSPHLGLLTAEGKDIGLLRGAQELDEESRRAIEEELERAYFVPTIITVYDIEERFGVSRWQVETDRGPRTFEVREREEVRLLPSGKVLIRDADGNLLEIPDCSALDRSSQMLVEMHV